MTSFGYTLMTEQAGPKQLVRDAAHAERVGFDFEVMSDHYSPWLAAQGHAPPPETFSGHWGNVSILFSILRIPFASITLTDASRLRYPRASARATTATS